MVLLAAAVGTKGKRHGGNTNEPRRPPKRCDVSKMWGFPCPPQAPEMELTTDFPEMLGPLVVERDKYPALWCGLVFLGTSLLWV